MASNRRKAVPEARAALDQFKYVANELGVPLKQGYNGDLTLLKMVLWVDIWLKNDRRQQRQWLINIL